jgi:hypothetical protein
MKKLLPALLLSAVFVSGCASDPRPAEEQQSELHAAATMLSGTYDVVDSRQNYHEVSTVVIRKASHSDQIDVLLLSQAFGQATLTGKKCQGWMTPDQAHASMMCWSSTVGINFYRLHQAIGADEAVKDYSLIPRFAPMTVPDGDYSLETTDSGSGRVHWYVLSRHTVLSQ